MATMLEHMLRVADAGATALLGSVWQGILLAAWVALCLRTVPRLTATVRWMVWLAVFLIVCALDVVSLSTLRGSPTTVAGGRFPVDARWAVGLMSVWAAVSAVRVLQLAVGGFRLAGIARRADVFEAPDPAGERRLPIRVSSEVERPGVVGFGKPCILLPAGLAERLTNAELEAVILHEREHVRRGDHWTNLLQKVALALMPLNPVLAWVERRLCRERELACDDHVLRQTRARKVYAGCLAQMAEAAMVRRPVALALGVLGSLGRFGRRTELARRVGRILATPEKPLGRRATAAVTMVLLSGLAGGGVVLTRCPRLVSFVPGADEVRMAATAPAATSGMPLSRPAELGAGGARLVRTAVRMDEAASVGECTRVRVKARLRPARHGGVGGQTFLRSSARTLPARRSGWIVMTRFSGDRPDAPRLVSVGFAVTDAGELLQTSYAAVPAGNGWLVVEL